MNYGVLTGKYVASTYMGAGFLLEMLVTAAGAVPVGEADENYFMPILVQLKRLMF